MTFFDLTEIDGDGHRVNLGPVHEDDNLLGDISNFVDLYNSIRTGELANSPHLETRSPELGNDIEETGNDSRVSAA
jgi:hypothetical protein